MEAYGPPGQNGGAANGTSGVPEFADALARARQIAAKIGDDTVSMKRSYDGSSDSQPDLKKMATDPAALRNSTDQQRATQAAQAAAAAAALVNSKLGVSPGVSAGPSASGPVYDIPQTENITVPDRLVGLLIGKGGEQIASIQSQTECRVQFSQEGGQPERLCTLTGTPSAITKAKETIHGLVAKLQGQDRGGSGYGGSSGGGGGAGGEDSNGTVELMIPGGKVGLIIGKQGETIKMLQERAGVKIIVIQDSNAPTSHDKPLRITGDRMSCQRAKDMVLDLLAEKDMQMGGAFGGGDAYGGRGRNTLEVQVPRTMMGLIIGKGGEMIKKIQEESGSRVQFRQEDDMGGPNRICSVTGDDQCNQTAANMINELIQNGLQRQGGMGGGSGFGGAPGGWGGPGGPPRGGFQPEGTQYAIPADKCGLVIGKGGETIREINRQSGAHVELNRDSSSDRHQRLFRINGTPDQIQHAVALIHEKAGLPPVGFPGPMGPMCPGPMGPPMGPMGPGPMGGPMGPGPMGPPMGNPYGPPNPQGMPMAQPGMMPQQPAYGQPWPNPYQPQPQVPMAYGQPAPIDPTKQQQQQPVVDPNAAAWAAYYAQYYQQQPQTAMQPQAPAAQPMGYQAASAPAAAPAQPQPTVNQATGQLDYSAAWAEYYRQQGMHQHAAAILANQAQPHG